LEAQWSSVISKAELYRITNLKHTIGQWGCLHQKTKHEKYEESKIIENIDVSGTFIKILLGEKISSLWWWAQRENRTLRRGAYQCRNEKRKRNSKKEKHNLIRLIRDNIQTFKPVYFPQISIFSWRLLWLAYQKKQKNQRYIKMRISVAEIC
jgi:hypothetical protein